MKVVVLCGKGQVGVPGGTEPVIGDDDILLEVKACGIWGSDSVFLLCGRLEPMGQVLLIIRHEFAGAIAGIEKNKFPWTIGRPGDRVVSENTGDACGRCPSWPQVTSWPSSPADHGLFHGRRIC